ncbi:MAG: protein translocase SEC61 complex subunit gamma [Aigarchaeota archaeon]|nr:protein translocase SEC61 complex subunit gamma [Aigarchaeota archaeon]
MRRRLRWPGNGLKMGLREFLKEASVTLRLAAKPTRKEFMLSLKIALIGIALIGIISYLIRFIALALQSF